MTIIDLRAVWRAEHAKRSAMSVLESGNKPNDVSPYSYQAPAFDNVGALASKFHPVGVGEAPGGAGGITRGGRARTK